MNKMMFEELYIYSIDEKVAKKVLFKDGCNILTSSAEAGNDRGKSTIMKSIYYTLGADLCFTNAWNVESKICVIKVKVNNKTYYIQRDKEIFKAYDSNFKKIFATGNRQGLAEFYKNNLGFCKFLPNRSENNFEITPPVYNFLINYIDQTRMDCTELKSFEKLSQYKNYKENILWEYLGVMDETYFKNTLQKDELENKNTKLKKKVSIKNEFILQIDRNINNKDYSKSFDNLKNELDENKNLYLEITKKLSSLKKKLSKFRNEKEELLIKIKEINKKEKENVLEKNSEFFNKLGKYILLKNEFENYIVKLDRGIELEEEKYKRQLKVLEKFEEKLKFNTEEVEDVFKYRGLIALRDTYVCEKTKLQDEIKDNNNVLAPIKKNLIKNKELMKKINEKYCELMKRDIEELNLANVIDKKSIKNITTKYQVGGSNIPLATMMYYMNIQELIYEFNTKDIIFPVIIDSPNNTESDAVKEKLIYDYIFSKINSENQYIISGIGIKQENFKQIKFDNIIVLENEKYKLLNAKDFKENIELLSKFI